MLPCASVIARPDVANCQTSANVNAINSALSSFGYRGPSIQTGEFVTGYDGWQQFAVSKGKDLRKLDPHAVPVSTAIGVLGIRGWRATPPRAD